MTWPLLHIYAQQGPHHTVEIRGTVEAVQKLAVLFAAAAHGDRETLETFFAADGEGFKVAVSVVSDAEMDRLALPYCDWGKE